MRMDPEQEINILKDQIQRLERKLSEIENGIRIMTPQTRLPYFILHIADHCNLNCAGCNHLSSLADSRFISVEVLRRDMEQMHRVHGDVPRIGIMGGEPLLHPELKKILSDARDIFRESELLLSTNGILCGSMDGEFWDICREKKITIRFTRYPVKLDYDALIERIKCLGVKVDFFLSSTEALSVFQSVAFDVTGGRDPLYSFQRCSFANKCTVVAEGKMYPCPIVQNSIFFAREFGFDMPIGDADYIDLYRDGKKDTLEFLARPVPFCRFCDVDRRNALEFNWRVTGRDRYEWMEFTFRDCDIAYLKNGGRVFIYGAGDWGTRAVRILQSREVRIEGVIVSDMTGNPAVLDGVMVSAVDGVKFAKDDICIIAVYGQAKEEIRRRLTEKGVRRIIPIMRIPQ